MGESSEPIRSSVLSVSARSPPLLLSGEVVKGFGRGSKELGIPTANLPDESFVGKLMDDESGIYFGWAELRGEMYKMVTSIGWNPYFDNKKKTVEPHLLHTFDEDFYGENLKILICGFLRPEQNYSSLDSLIDAIQNDIRVSSEVLDLPEYQAMQAVMGE